MISIRPIAVCLLGTFIATACGKSEPKAGARVGDTANKDTTRNMADMPGMAAGSGISSAAKSSDTAKSASTIEHCDEKKAGAE